MPPARQPTTDNRPLAVHVVYRFGVGGLENGVVSLVNRMTDWRHAIVALTDAAPAFCARIQRDDVLITSLQQPPGHGWRSWPALWRLFRQWRPTVVHTRNLAALEMQMAAFWAGVPWRVHSEHGRELDDLGPKARRYGWIRRLYAPLVNHFIVLSPDLEQYLVGELGFRSARVTRICNGVDVDRFSPSPARLRPPGCPHSAPGLCLVGTVGRMQTIKAQTLLARAFVQALQARPDLRATLRLVLVGDGPLRADCEQILLDHGMGELAWLPGERDDVPAVMRGLDLFVLPSLSEGISNTILEAMACGLPVLATAVGGNADLVADGVTGQLVPPGDVDAMAAAILRWSDDPVGRRTAGAAGRARVEQCFSLQAMVRSYQDVYARGGLQA